MPLRDDHAAALARAEALQRELDQKRAADAQQVERLARLEKELGEARSRLGRAEGELARLRAAPRTPVPPEPVDDMAGPDRPVPPELRVLAVLVLIGLGLIAVISSGLFSDGPPARAVEPPLEVSLPPSPAELASAKWGSPSALPDIRSFTADHLLADGLRRLLVDGRVQSISLRGVKPYGMLDLTHGHISIMGAPRDPAVPLCPAVIWTPRSGWVFEQLACSGSGREIPSAPAICPVAQMLALVRQQGVPDGLAHISARLSLDAHDWRWTFEIEDDGRGSAFVREFSSRDCPK